MDLESFTPRGFDQPTDEILPTEPPDLEFESAGAECGEVIDKLTSDIAGIGPKAAERYLLRFEYGFDTAVLRDSYDISKSTLSKQTNQVHRKVLEHPTVARTVGQFRANRAELTRPATSNQTLWEGELDLYSNPIYTAVHYLSGDVTTPYSWKLEVRADFTTDEKTRRLRCSYLIDEEYGVLLKRTLKGISASNQPGDFRYERLRTYRVFPLPHPQLPTTDGTLLNALEQHVSHDIKRCFEDPAWSSIENMISFVDADDPIPRPLPEQALPEKLATTRPSREQIRTYTAETHRRDNLEHLLRAYPFTRLEHIPHKTIDVLWNGSVATIENHLQDILRTSEPRYHPGPHRTIWSLG